MSSFISSKTIFPKKDKTKCKLILKPCDVITTSNNGDSITIELSLHQCSKRYIKYTNCQFTLVEGSEPVKEPLRAAKSRQNIPKDSTKHGDGLGLMK